MALFGVGDKVQSKHHGNGVVVKIEGGAAPVWCEFDIFGAKRIFCYQRDGKYFSVGHFKDEEPVLFVTEKFVPAPEAG